MRRQQQHLIIDGTPVAVTLVYPRRALRFAGSQFPPEVWS